MPKGKAPADQFYYGDWLRDTELQMCSCSTRGIWMNFLSHMWFAKDKGILEGTVKELEKLSGAPPSEMKLFFDEANRHGFCDMSQPCPGIVTVTNRRMSRKDKDRRKVRERKRNQRERDKQKDDVTQDVTDGVTKKSHLLSSTASSSPKKKTSKKEKYADLKNVFLKKDEYKKLIDKFGGVETLNKIETLSEYIASKGDKYKSHYATILSWYRKEKKEEMDLSGSFSGRKEFYLPKGKTCSSCDFFKRCGVKKNQIICTHAINENKFYEITNK